MGFGVGGGGGADQVSGTFRIQGLHMSSPINGRTAEGIYSALVERPQSARLACTNLKRDEG